MRILDCYFVNYADTETKKISAEELDQLDQGLESLFYFALTWSFGATGDYDSREKFNSYLVEQIKQFNPSYVYPEESNFYESYYDPSARTFT